MKRQKSLEELNEEHYLCKKDIQRLFGVTPEDAYGIYIRARRTEFEKLGYNVCKTKASADLCWKGQAVKKRQVPLTSAK